MVTGWYPYGGSRHVDKAFMGRRCFFLGRVDGSSIEFSFISCVNGRAPTPHQEFMQAGRMAVQEQLRATKVCHFERNTGLREGSRGVFYDINANSNLRPSQAPA